MRFNSLWWWIDRWRKSTAFTDMSLAEQGAYRNLLDEAALRGGAIPDNDRILERASGDVRAWARVKNVVMARFDLRDDGWHNATLDEVLHQSQRRAEKQQRWRERQGGNAAGNGGGNAPVTQPVTRRSQPGNKRGNKPGYPDPDPDLKDKKNTPPLRGGVGGFEPFWTAYPKKKSKADALKAWKKIAPSPELANQILAAVQSQRTWADWLREDGRFIPYPATWLNARRWEDEPEIAAPIAVAESVPWDEECRSIHLGVCESRYEHANWMQHGPLPVQQKAYLAKKKANGGVRA